jgi:hypothetical protein
VISTTQEILPDNTQNSQQTEIYAPAGIESTIPTSEWPHIQTGHLQLLVRAIKDFFSVNNVIL